MIFFFVLLWMASNFIISFLGQFFVPYLGFFPYKDLFELSKLPNFILSLANFDGLHYVIIASQGYQQFQQAFFPLFPLLIKGLTFLTRDYFLSGLIISNISFLIGTFIFTKYLKAIKVTDKNILWTIVFLLAFPTSFYFGALYTEGLFFLLLISSLYFFQKKQFIFAAVFALLTSLTRFIGIFLFVPFLITLLVEAKTQRLLRLGTHWTPRSKKDLCRASTTVILLLAPLLGLFIYSFYLLKTTGDPLNFLNSQKAFAGRDPGLVIPLQVYFRYFKIFLTAKLNFQYAISLLEFITFNGVLLVLALDLYKIIKKKLYVTFPQRLALNIFSLFNLIIPTFTGTFLSIPRFVLLSLSFFIFLGESRSLIFKISLLVFFLILHVILVALFIQGYFIS